MTTNNKQRQTWSSRLTYVMTVAGATVGFGATWRFPSLWAKMVAEPTFYFSVSQ